MLILLITLFFAGQTRWFQNAVAHFGADYLSEKLHTKIKIDNLYINFFQSVTVDGLYVEDPQKDTVAYVQHLYLDLHSFDWKQRKIIIDSVKLNNSYFAYKEFEGKKTNMSFLIDYFNPNPDTTKKTPSKPFEIGLNHIDINNFTFIYKNEENLEKHNGGMNYTDIRASKVNLKAQNININDDVIIADLKNLGFEEQCGFVLNNLSAKLKYTPKEIELNDLKLITPNSDLGRYIALRFEHFADFEHFVSKVQIEAEFKNAHLDFKDIAFFAPSIQSYTLKTDINGKVKGTISDLKATDITLRSGKHTVIRGHVTMKGLPDINKTDMHLSFSDLTTSAEDANRILASIDQADVALPTLLHKAGIVHFKGAFSDRYNDFKVKGDLRTDLGIISTDLAMNLRDHKKPFYKGYVNATDFNLGALTDVKGIGRSSFYTEVEGSGFSLNTIDDQVLSKIAYFEYNGYRFKAIDFNGTFKHKVFSGAFKINDEHLAIDFDGSVDLSGKVPEYNFTADIPRADLMEIKLLKEPICISTCLASKFSGSNADNILGEVLLLNTHLITPKADFKLDTVQLISRQNADTTKTLIFRSDMFNVGMRGVYNVKRIQSSFKSLLSAYIPSYQWKKQQTAAHQQFRFAMQLNDLTPITTLFIPDLDVPEKGRFVGSFDSEKDKLELSGSVKKIKYKDVVIDDFILDQGNNQEALYLNIGLGKISRDSLVFNDVAMSNSLKNDRVTTNLKLADPSGTNALDLNAELFFTPDTTQFTVLPSALKLNNEDWTIDDQFRVLFADKGYVIENFSLHNGEQTLSLEGSISKSEEDPLTANLHNLNIAMANPFLKTRGLVLSGILNGGTSISSVLSAPKVSADISIKDLSLNGNLLGDAEISSGWYSETNDVNFSMNIQHQNLSSIAISGSLQPNKDQENLFADIELNETNMIIFQPFLTGIVSDLSGAASANVLVQGTLTAPRINGAILFNKAGFKVDYLNTKYTVSDKLGIRNGLIDFDGFKLMDEEQHVARASGKLDLSNFNNIKLDLGLNATDFQALNTGPSDNDLYYGTAYASGNFKFKGSFKDMAININATTSPGTKFFLPISSESSIGSDNLVTFLTRDTVDVSKKEAPMKLLLEMDLTVNPSAEASVLLGENSGGTMFGKGNGNLQLRLNTLGDFNMFGTYTLNEGKYDLSIPGISKQFKVVSGGTVRFNGDPIGAQVDVSGSYDARTSLSELYSAAGLPADGPEAKQRIPVSSLIHVTGGLSDMKYEFGVAFPQNESLFQNTFGGYFSDNENQKTQSFSILTKGGFTSGGVGVDQGAGAGFGLDLAGSIVTSTVNELINQDWLDLNAGFVNGGVEAGANFRLFKNRLIINGSVTSLDRNAVNTGNLSTNNSSALSSDVDLEYLIFPEGTLRLKLYNRSNTATTAGDLTNSYIPYRQGLGILFRKDFDNWSQFFENTRKREKDFAKRRQLRLEQREEDAKKKREDLEKLEKEQKKIDELEEKRRLEELQN